MKNKSLDEGTALVGFILGILLGGLVGLFRGPRFRMNKQQVVHQVTRLTQDELEQSIMYGKEVARRQRP